jgi:rhodanese-related sulfurtransferase
MSVDQQTPSQAYAAIREGDAVLVDVRTRPEWAFVGVPDLSDAGKAVLTIEWRRFPDMSVNDGFVAELTRQLGGKLPSAIYFICRSGARSHDAAATAAASYAAAGLTTTCINVAEGFEGDLDPEGHRGRSNGWKARELPWQQN